MSRVIAITGVSGYVGTKLVPRLEACQDVEHIVGIDVNEPQIEFSKGHSIKADVRHPQIIEIIADEKVDTVVHLAFVQDPIHETSRAHELDVIGTMKVLNACSAAGVKKVVIASSYVVYGPYADNPNFLTEDRPLRGLKGFQVAKDKLEVERLTKSYKRKHPETLVTTLRPAMVLGPNARHFIARLIESPVLLSVLGFDPLLQFLHEEDMVEAYYQAVTQDGDGVYNVAGDGIIPLSKAIRLAGRPALPLPHFLAEKVQSVLWSARLSPAPPVMLQYLRYISVMSNQKFKETFNWQPRFTSEETFRDFIQHRRSKPYVDENPDDLLLPNVEARR